MGRVKLEKSISIKIPKDSTATFEALPDLGIKKPVVCLWDDDELQCIISADSQPVGYTDEQYWDKLDNAIKKDFIKVKRVKEGEYESRHAGRVSYRIYRDSVSGDESTQVYHLVKNKDIVYWVIGVLINYEEIFAVHNEIIKFVKTAKLIA